MYITINIFTEDPWKSTILFYRTSELYNEQHYMKISVRVYDHGEIYSSSNSLVRLWTLKIYLDFFSLQNITVTSQS